MNTNTLKRFARAARLKLMDQIGAKLEKVLTTDSAELREKTGAINKLREAINATTKEQVIDTVAYTWFNRLVALRFMDVNGYEPTGVKVVSPGAGATLPELLQEAKSGHIPDELKVNHQRIYDLLDGKIPAADAQTEAYRELLVGACNHLHAIFPFLFERIDDYSELLLPDDLLSEFSILEDLKTGMPAEDCREVEILGWLYQFYISEKKDEVFAAKGKVKKEDIPAATQLFTPRWIVEYMVQNTVGKLWLQNNPKSSLRDHMPYFIESPSVAPSGENDKKENDGCLKINSVEEITLLDQACGSGHILVYGFELLSKIYEEEGYNESEIPKLIIEKNLYGFEIDQRAAQLAGLALMLKARSYQRRLFRKEITPNIHCYKDLTLTEDECTDTLAQIHLEVSDALLNDLSNMRQATNLGSLMVPKADPVEINNALETVKKKLNTTNVFLKHRLIQLEEAFDQLALLRKKYHCVVANPPYMGGGKMNNEMASWIKSNYPISKADLFSCFIERSLEFVPMHGYNGLVTMESWMFLSSFEKFRQRLLKESKILSLSHFGWHIMRIAFGTVAFILEKSKPEEDFVGVYSYMEYDNIDREVDRPKIFPVKDNGRFKLANQNDFQRIPGSPIGYWLSEPALKSFINYSHLSDICETRKGLATSDNNRFLRLWQEVKMENSSYLNLIESDKKWYPHNKGGNRRKWYGNNEYLINWENNGYEIRNFRDGKGKIRSRPQNLSYSFKQAVTWSKISSGDFSARICYGGFLFDDAAAICYSENLDTLKGINSFLNTKVCQNLLDAINPTLNIQISDIGGLPVYINEDVIYMSAENSTEISIQEWNSRETSWDFKQNELIRIGGQDFEEAYDSYCQYWQKKFFELHKNEEELNRRFIEIYGLEDELTPDVPLEDITILKDETDIKNGKLVFDAKEVCTQFISYAVGCMFGRYSLDKEGLILANQGETLEDFLTKVEVADISDLKFVPDDDNIIPVLDDEWFEDDIVGRFYKFLKVTFGKEDFEKNLTFIEDSIGCDIRKFFDRDFYKDHIRRYKKRPIYWMFSSPSGAFNALIYMHRYTPDTLNQLLNGYLKDYRGKLQVELERQAHLKNEGTAREQTRAAKEEDRIHKSLFELQEYEREVYKLATERIEIDLDDGVLVNYNKFGDIIKEVKGLNDKKAKDKVRKFDWIDTTTIR